MKILKPLSLCCVLVCSAAVHAVNVSGRLSDAVVFRTGAELHQTVSVNLQRGDNEICVDGLSPVAEQGSFRITTGPGVCLVAHEYTVEKVAEGREISSIRRLRDSLAMVEQHYRALGDESVALTQMLTLLNEGVGQSLSAERQAVTPAAIDKGLEYYRQRSADLYAQKAEKEREQQLWKAKADALKEQLSTATANNAGRTGVLTMRLNASHACRATLDVRYFTYSASWQPAYDASIASTQGPFVLASKALLTQTTGWDWEKVRLTFSTALPRNGLSAPEPSKWLLRKQEPMMQKRSMMYAAAAGTNMLAVMPEAAYEADMAADETMAGEAWDGREFVVETPYTIPCNGKPQTVALGTETIDNAVYSLYTMPQADNRVYLRAQLTDLDSRRLMAGNVAVSYNGTYYGEQYLNPSSADNETNLTIGEEPLIAVERERLEEYSRTKQLANETRVNALYKITLKNNTGEAATVTLKETYPVSATKGIEVELSDKTTQWQANDKERGILTYNIALQPGEVKEVLIGYSVKYPKDWHINFR